MIFGSFICCINLSFCGTTCCDRLLFRHSMDCTYISNNKIGEITNLEESYEINMLLGRVFFILRTPVGIQKQLRYLTATLRNV